MRVFISSASGDQLSRYRKAAVKVCHRLGLVPVHMEEFDPQRSAPVQVCREQVESCQVFVLLLAHRYGSRPDGELLCYTELEYEWAVRRPEMGVLAFVAAPEFPWPFREIDLGADADAMAAFVARVQAAHTVTPLGSPTAFAAKLEQVLRRRMGDTWHPRDEPGPVPPPEPPHFRASPPYVGGAPFTGRVGDLEMLDDWGRSADPLIVVEAMGGTGKSALAWEWVSNQDRAPRVVPGLAGRFWWSFYEGSASMTKFLQELVAYTSSRTLGEVREMERAELADEAVAQLSARPYLVVLDGFERLLAAYHRFDPSRLRDEEVELGQRWMIEPQADEIVRRLAAAGPSKLLISTRLMPTALQSRFRQPVPGVRHVRLPGLSDDDTRELLVRLKVQGSASAIARFFGPMGNHPLLVGIVAGLVTDYRPAPGAFDSWLADPAAGGAHSVNDLDLTRRSAHILEAALAGLRPWPRELLELISALPGAVSWQTLDGLNPRRPQPPGPGAVDLTSLGPEPKLPDNSRFGPGSQALEDRKLAWDRYAAEVEDRRLVRNELVARARKEQLAAWERTKPVVRARAELDQGLRELEDRGLLWWDRAANTYDLHPIVRAYTYGQLDTPARIKVNGRIHSHFAALPAEDMKRAVSVEDLTRTITIFRALVGAGHLDEAGVLWQRGLAEALQRQLGAHATVVELLTPVARVRSELRVALAISLWFMGRYSEAITEETEILADSLRQDRAVHVRFALGNLTLSLIEAGSLAAAARGCELRGEVNAAADVEKDGSLSLHQAMLAAVQGKASLAARLLHQADIAGPAGQGLWHRDHISYWRLYLALRVDGTLTNEQLRDAAAVAHSWQHRLDLVALRYELFAGRQEYDQAMAAASEYERLSRNAGLDTVPARSAFALAKLGRQDEADAAIEEALTRQPRIHPARFPHYRLAQALWERGRQDEAAAHADAAYRQAWCDGPPYCREWELRDAAGLLAAMGRPVPARPAADSARSVYPFQDEVRSFIVAYRMRYGRSSRH